MFTLESVKEIKQDISGVYCLKVNKRIERVNVNKDGIIISGAFCSINDYIGKPIKNYLAVKTPERPWRKK